MPRAALRYLPLPQHQFMALYNRLHLACLAGLAPGALVAERPADLHEVLDRVVNLGGDRVACCVVHDLSIRIARSFAIGAVSIFHFFFARAVAS